MKGKCAGNSIFVEINHGFIDLDQSDKRTRVPPGILPPPWPVQATVRPNPPEPGPPAAGASVLQWPFQEPKLKVHTIYNFYVRSM